MKPAGKDLAQLEAGLAQVREALRLDGADLEVLGLEGAEARVRLIIGPEACLDCILPKEFLEQMLLHDVQAAMPEVTHITLDDPRASDSPPRVAR
jgi:hypothetical protein